MLISSDLNGNTSHFYSPYPRTINPKETIYIHLFLKQREESSRRQKVQGSQYHTEGCTGLASGTVYFGYQSIPMYRFGFTAIFLYLSINIYIYVCMYVCMCVCVCVCVCVCIIINIKVYHKTFPQFRTNYSWF